MNSMSSHLTLEELTGDTELPPAAHTHRTTCAHCRAESSDWAAVAAAAKLITTAAQPSPAGLHTLLQALDTEPRQARKRPVLRYAAAAAAVTVLGAASYGLGTALTAGGQHGNATKAVTAAFTATGCSSLEVTAGTLARLTGQDLSLATSAGRTVPVTTTSATEFLRVTTGTAAGITQGARVLVTGTSAGGTLTATAVTILPDTATAPGQLSGDGPGTTEIVAGLVTGARDGTFTVTASSGHTYTVAASGTTTVITTVRITAAQLSRGEFTTATGVEQAGGSLAASTVEQLDVPAATWAKLRPAPPSAPSGLPALSGIATPSAPSAGDLAINGLGCAPAAISTSYLLTASE
jgi:hypothetical protein